MDMVQIREIALRRGVDANENRQKFETIRDIQISEGYFPCFGTRLAAKMIVCGNQTASAKQNDL